MKKYLKITAAIAIAAALMAGNAGITIATSPASPTSPSGSNVASTFTGWKAEQEGNRSVWRYYQKGDMMEYQWLKSGDCWYYLGDDGIMVTGWEEIDDVTYYFKSDGAMVTGWQKVANGNSGSGPAGGSGSTGWYYFNESGGMATGWKYLASKWYYFADDDVDMSGFEDGQMLYGEVSINGGDYYFGTADDGAMKTGLVKVESAASKSGPGSSSSTTTAYSYYNIDGTKKQSAWLNENGKWYYFDEEGIMVKGKLATNASGEYVDYDDSSAKYYYYMDDTTGVMKTGWVQIKNDSSKAVSPTSGSSSTSYYQYYDTDGSLRTGWLNLSGKWYYLADKEDIKTTEFKDYALGQMAVDAKVVKDGSKELEFFFNSNGQMAENSWKEISSTWYYYGANGVRYKAASSTDLLVSKISSKYYVFNQNGAMLVNTTVYKVGNKWTEVVPTPTAATTYDVYNINKSGVATAGTKKIS